MASVHELYAEGEKLKDDGKYEEAKDKFLEVLQIDQDFALAHLALAVMYGKLGDHQQAVQHGERACDLEPTDPFSFTALSVTYQRAMAATQDWQYMHKAEEAMARAHMLEAQR